MSQTSQISLDLYHRFLELQRMGNEAVHAAQEENRRLGVPNVYSRNGQLYWELPDGRLTMEDPYLKQPVGDAPTAPGDNGGGPRV